MCFSEIQVKTKKLSEMMTADENKCAFSSGSGAMTTDSTGSATPPHMDEEGELLAGGKGRNYAAYTGPKENLLTYKS